MISPSAALVTTALMVVDPISIPAKNLSIIPVIKIIYFTTTLAITKPCLITPDMETAVQDSEVFACLALLFHGVSTTEAQL